VQCVTFTATALLGLACASIVHAQDASDSVAYRALIQTPPGALATPLGASILGPEAGRWDVHVRYGIMSFGDGDEYIHNFGIGGDLKLGAGRIGLTAGAWLPNCDAEDDADGCSGHFMAALSFGERLVEAALGRPSGTASLNVGIDVAAAIGTPRDATLFATSASLPISLVTATSGLRLTPYVAPGFGTGLVSEDGETEAGLRALFGAGVGVLGLARGIAVNAAIHRVFMRDGNWLVGVGVTYTGAQ
jgi:hypothetical protein